MNRRVQFKYGFGYECWFEYESGFEQHRSATFDGEGRAPRSDAATGRTLPTLLLQTPYSSIVL